MPRAFIRGRTRAQPLLPGLGVGGVELAQERPHGRPIDARDAAPPSAPPAPARTPPAAAAGGVSSTRVTRPSPPRPRRRPPTLLAQAGDHGGHRGLGDRVGRRQLAGAASHRADTAACGTAPCSGRRAGPPVRTRGTGRRRGGRRARRRSWQRPCRTIRWPRALSSRSRCRPETSALTAASSVRVPSAARSPGRPMPSSGHSSASASGSTVLPQARLRRRCGRRGCRARARPRGRR